jgi:helicase
VSSQISQPLLLANDEGFRSEVAQVRAKAILSELLGEPPSYRWSYVAARIVRNVTSALMDLEDIAAVDPEDTAGYAEAARLFAQGWEALAQLEEKTNRSTAVANAAVAYELAGYQANSAHLASKLISRVGDPVLSPLDLVSLFLQRRFLLLTSQAASMRTEPEGIREVGPELWAAAASGVISLGLERAARYFLAGDEARVPESIDLLRSSERGYSAAGMIREANLAHSLASLLPLMVSRSTWSNLLPLLPDNKRWRRYLTLLARGTGEHVIDNASVSELWPSQKLAVERGLLTSESNVVVRMPTSAGKTRVAELAIAEELISEVGGKCVYIAPYRALVSEVQQTLLTIFSDLGFAVSSLAGSYESDDFEEVLAAEGDILVLTPEKLDLVARLYPEQLEAVKLFVVDEGQLLDDPSRGIKFELLLSRLRALLPNARFIFLSAVIPSETLEDLSDWLSLQEEGILESSWRPSVQRVASFGWQGQTGVLRYSTEEDVPVLGEFVSGLVSRGIYRYRNPATGRMNLRRFPESGHKGHTAAELAFKFADLGPVLVFCAQTNHAESVARAVDYRLELLEKTGGSIPPHFRAQDTRSLLIARSWLGDDHLVPRLMEKGIALHHGRLPEAVRSAVESDFRERKYRVLVATNTLAQGVNLPVRTVIVHSCWRNIETTEGSYTRDRISARDYWNIAGRAGRAGEETEGTIVHIVMSSQDRQDYEYYLASRQTLEPVRSALFRLLNDLVNDRINELEAGDKLDPEVLALVAEEAPADVDQWADEIISGTLAAVQAQKANLSTSALEEAVAATAVRITQEVPDPEVRTAYSATGLRTSSCQTLHQVIDNNPDLARYISAATVDDVADFGTVLVNACLTLEEMQPQLDFAGSYEDLLREWLSGLSVQELRLRHGEESTSSMEFGRFLEDFFGYRLPWGIAAIVRIASQSIPLEASEISPVAAFFPSMVKYGLPNPQATWAMSSGIPFRDVAIRVAGLYLRDHEATDYRAFLRWLGTIDLEALAVDFGLRGPILEDVARALSRAGINPLLEEFASVGDWLPRTVTVRGIRFGDRRLVASGVQDGQTLVLAREYANYVDRNAIAVMAEGGNLGYLPREVAQLLSPEMDTGLSVGAQARDIHPGDIPRVSVRLFVNEQS